MFDNFFKIDKSMGEKRSHQITGAILLIAIIIFAVFWNDIKVWF